MLQGLRTLKNDSESLPLPYNRMGVRESQIYPDERQIPAQTHLPPNLSPPLDRELLIAIRIRT